MRSLKEQTSQDSTRLEDYVKQVHQALGLLQVWSAWPIGNPFAHLRCHSELPTCQASPAARAARLDASIYDSVTYISQVVQGNTIRLVCQFGML